MGEAGGSSSPAGMHAHQQFPQQQRTSNSSLQVLASLQLDATLASITHEARHDGALAERLAHWKATFRERGGQLLGLQPASFFVVGHGLGKRGRPLVGLGSTSDWMVVQDAFYEAIAAKPACTCALHHLALLGWRQLLPPLNPLHIPLPPGGELSAAIASWQERHQLAAVLSTGFLDGSHPIVDAYELGVRLQHMLRRLTALAAGALVQVGGHIQLVTRLRW